MFIAPDFHSLSFLPNVAYDGGAISVKPLFRIQRDGKALGATLTDHHGVPPSPRSWRSLVVLR
ncbi:MAG TPA: hypothetical protein V6D19_26060 [Stenomitos sp.]